MEYKITCKDCIHFHPQQTVVDEIRTEFGTKAIVVDDPLKPAFCDYINGTTSRNHVPCRYGFKLKIDREQKTS